MSDLQVEAKYFFGQKVHDCLFLAKTKFIVKLDRKMELERGMSERNSKMYYFGHPPLPPATH